MHCLYIIWARKLNVGTHVKITQQWKSALTEATRSHGGSMEDMSNFLRLGERPCRCCVELHCATVMGREF